jgi:hypothetical protein
MVDKILISAVYYRNNLVSLVRCKDPKEVKVMKDKIIVGVAVVAATFVLAGGAALAQSPSMSPTPSPSSNTMVPSAAPATGFGAN